MKRETNEYCDKARLKELIHKYNRMNYNDDGKWLERYTKRMNTKKNNSSMSDDDFDCKIEFVERKRQQIQKTREYWANLTSVERSVYNEEFYKISEELTKNFVNIINGRINSYRLWQHPELNDIKQEALLALYKYINRYDSDSDTSAFAYTTQIVNNAFNLYLQDYNKHNENEVVVGDWYANMGDKDDSLETNLRSE